MPSSTCPTRTCATTTRLGLLFILQTSVLPVALLPHLCRPMAWHAAWQGICCHVCSNLKTCCSATCCCPTEPGSRCGAGQAEEGGRHARPSPCIAAPRLGSSPPLRACAATSAAPARWRLRALPAPCHGAVSPLPALLQMEYVEQRFAKLGRNMDLLRRAFAHERCVPVSRAWCVVWGPEIGLISTSSTN